MGTLWVGRLCRGMGTFGNHPSSAGVAETRVSQPSGGGSGSLPPLLLQVNVFGFGADSRGNWHHYWENNRYAGEFRKTGVHDADFEAHIIDMLAKTSKIEVYRGN